MSPSQQSSANAAVTGGGSSLTINIKVAEQKITLESADPVTSVAADSRKAPRINVEDKLTLEAYVSYFKWWALLNFFAGYWPILVALGLSHENLNLTSIVLACSSGICFWASCLFLGSVGAYLSHIDQINTRTFRIYRLLGYLTFLCGLYLLCIVVTYILSTPVAPALAPA